ILDMMNPSMMNHGWNGPMNRYPLVDPLQLDYQVSFKQFAEYMKRTSNNQRIDDEELQKRFAVYREKFAARQLTTFFNANKEKEWFQEKYHPTLSIPRQEDVKMLRRRYLQEFLVELEKGEFDNVNFDKKDEADTDDNKMNVDSAAEDANAEYESRLVIKTVPPTIARKKIKEMCCKVEGFDYLALSEPSPNKKFHRVGWIQFKEGTDMKKVFEQLDGQKVDDFIFHLAMNRKDSNNAMQQNRTHRTTPDVADTTERLQKDLEQAKEICIAFETMLGEDTPEGLKAVESRIEKMSGNGAMADNEPASDIVNDDKNSEERRKLKKSLDLIIAYLRRVHMYCYYCALECDSLDDLNRRCCNPHYRTVLSSPAANSTAANNEETTDPKQAAKTERQTQQWLKNLDQRISLKIHTPDDHELSRLGGRVLQTELDEFVKKHVLKEHESKYKCQVGECSKAFKGYDYVEKHILSKHPEETDKIKQEVDYYNNYVCDPNHIVPPSNNNNANGPGGAANGNPAAAAAMMGMGMPFGQPFMMHPRMGMPPAWDQIPRIGFGSGGPAGSAMMDLDGPMPRDPRQVKSYVDLDAPAEGDSNISFF
ncbi:arsenite-resistance protein 2-domain-containing protein, partial [Mycotypha africana]|uniref:arsenite-resistance protein 2-domain-containing protein n=1 Tax=Mycotypha africana TaxID=64632 RepID=UPI002301EF48